MVDGPMGEADVTDPFHDGRGSVIRIDTRLTPLRPVMRRLRHPHSFLWSVLTLVGGTVLAQAATILATPVLTRLYAPEDFGRFGIYAAFVAIASLAGAFNYEAAIVSADTDEEAAWLASLSLLLVLPMSILAAATLFLLMHASLFDLDELPDSSIVFACATVALTGTFTVLKYWLLRIGAFGPVSQAIVLQGVSRAIVQVGLGLAQVGLLGLLAGDTIGRAWGVERNLRRMQTWLKHHVRHCNSRRLLATAKRYRKFPMFSLPSTLMNSLAANLPIPLIAHYYGVEAAGFYALVSRVLAMPAALVGTSVADAFHSRIAADSRGDPRRNTRFLFRVAAGLLCAGVIPYLVLALAGRWVFGTIFGSQWAEAGAIAAALAPAALVRFAVSPLSRVVYVYEGQELKFVYDCLSLSTIAAVFVMSFHLGLTLVHAVLLFSAAQVLVYGVYFALQLRIVSQGRRAQQVGG